ncbi:uncharacterized protein LOC129612405 [Condylostylus longicornis]|uniref:uncharacterized protein LOC129612405 n=1 Tax=Condylostylus longicornis TaxID=2530218 RepID=UPI00244DC532|nr:uncharacterized protein LOC129612405 [Condylostylus longicornis]XP_055381949.1 uncharacterized protein LOC129612405 [Condylostylus longicornis]XP_055381950.1 uncharacterized protein LOC129612405 [Condylostylus longicornis]XP_055381951.1 uncharacterized protein LOC129612405 [Condylostylus longicornis]
MLKHVQISPFRNRSDSLSLRSSTSCASSLCGSPEPQNDLQLTPSRASSYSSLSETGPQTTIKVYTNCLRIDIEYKTLGIQWDTTSKEVITKLLKRLKMRHRDPKLFFLSMEVTVRSAGVKTVFVLDNAARPAILQACHPKGESRFCLQSKPGGLIRVHTSALQSSSQYKSLVISQETTSDELLCILLSCYNSVEPVEQFSLYEVCPGQEYQRKLHPDDIPLKAQNERIQRGETCHFLVRRNPNYPKRRQTISTTSTRSGNMSSNQNFSSGKIYDIDISEVNKESARINTVTPNMSNENSERQTRYPASEICIEKSELKFHDYNCFDNNFKQNQKCSLNGNTLVSLIQISTPSQYCATMLSQMKEQNCSVIKAKKAQQNQSNVQKNCQKCRNSFKSCEFCNKNLKATILHAPPQASTPSSNLKLTENLSVLQNSKHYSRQKCMLTNLEVTKYSPVYNIREIRTVSQSFSSLGNDKKIIDIDFETHFVPVSPTLKEKFSAKKEMTINGAISSPSITKSNKQVGSSVSNKNYASFLALIPFANKSQNFTKNNILPLKSKEVSGSLNDTNYDLISTEQSSLLRTGRNFLEIKVLNESEKRNAKPIEEVNNNPSKGLGHFVYI